MNIPYRNLRRETNITLFITELLEIEKNWKQFINQKIDTWVVKYSYYGNFYTAIKKKYEPIYNSSQLDHAFITSLRVEPTLQYYIRLPRWFQCAAKIGNHWPRTTYGDMNEYKECNVKQNKEVVKRHIQHKNIYIKFENYTCLCIYRHVVIV